MSCVLYRATATPTNAAFCRDKAVPPVEARVRERADVLSAFCSAIATLSHATVTSQAGLSGRVAACAAVGSAMERLSAFEEAAAHMELAHSLSATGGACLRVAEVSAASVAAAGTQTRVCSPSINRFVRAVSELQKCRRRASRRPAPRRGAQPLSGASHTPVARAGADAGWGHCDTRCAQKGACGDLSVCRHCKSRRACWPVSPRHSAHSDSRV